MTESKKIKIAFICTGNSARSQIAEGLTRKLGSDELIVQSAGVSPIGVAKKSIEVMAEIDIDISNHRSKSLSELDSDLDYAITLCDHADKNCPFLPAKNRLHWSMPDPHNLQTTTDRLEGFRQVREMLKIKITEFLNKHKLLRT